MEPNTEFFTYSRLSKIFCFEIHKTTLLKAEEQGLIPKAERFRFGSSDRTMRGWSMKDLPTIGERYGYIKKLQTPTCLAVFSTKGGVLKTSLSLNIARTYALHNVKTCVVGLDMQMDISNTLGLDSISDETEDDLSTIDQKLNSIVGLYDVYTQRMNLLDAIQHTDIPTLHYIPENSELVMLADLISTQPRREYWLKNNVVAPLKEKYDLIILDCSPNWNQLVTNALTSCDILVSPVECKINHYKNFEHYRKHLKKFVEKMELDFQTMYIPTKYSASRKLSNQIKRYYFNSLENCSTVGVRESVIGEEATAHSLSMQEYQPSKTSTEEMRELLVELNERLLNLKVH